MTNREKVLISIGSGVITRTNLSKTLDISRPTLNKKIKCNDFSASEINKLVENKIIN